MLLLRKAIEAADRHRDAEALHKLDHEIFGGDAFNNAEVWENYVPFWIVVDGVRVGAFAVEPDSAPVANFSGISVFAPNSLFLTSIGILPEYRGKGICAYAMEWLIAWAREQGFQVIVSNFRESNAGSRRLHERVGFVAVRRHPGYYPNPPEDAIVVKLNLR